MVTITFQRNDNKPHADAVGFTQDSVTLNGQKFIFPKDAGIDFESPHEQIIDAYRDADGELFACIIKQYPGSEAHIYEAPGFAQAKNDPQPKDLTLKPITIKIKPPELQNILQEKKDELQKIRERILDAQADEDETLLAELRSLRDQLKKEIQEAEEREKRKNEERSNL